MFKEEEKKLKDWQETLQKKSLPEDAVENAIWVGFQQAKNKKSRKRRPYLKRNLWSAIVAAVLLITIVTSIRVSPVFANAVASIPGMEKIVALIQDNRGLQSAIANKHYQEVNVVGQSSGTTITLNGVIPDAENMVVFYTIDYKQNHRSDFMEQVRIASANGEDLKVGSISHNYEENYETKMRATNSLEISFQEPLIEKDFVLEFEFINGYGEKEIVELPFSIDLEDAASQQYIVNEKVRIEGQSMEIIDVVIGPVRTAIQVKFDPNNTKEIYGFEDLQVVDGKGNRWSSIENGVTASMSESSPEIVTYYLQSNYFEEAEKLFVQFEKLMALDKEEALVEIDTEKELILTQPKGNRFGNVSLENNQLSIDFRGEKDFVNFPLNLRFKDADGQIFDINSWHSNGTDEEIDKTIGLDLPNESFKSPITFEIQGYPTYIEKQVNIPIKATKN